MEMLYILLFIYSVISQTTVYIDSTNGKDSFNCYSSNSPCSNITFVFNHYNWDDASTDYILMNDKDPYLIKCLFREYYSKYVNFRPVNDSIHPIIRIVHQHELNDELSCQVGENDPEREFFMLNFPTFTLRDVILEGPEDNFAMNYYTSDGFLIFDELFNVTIRNFRLDGNSKMRDSQEHENKNYVFLSVRKARNVTIENIQADYFDKIVNFVFLKDILITNSRFGGNSFFEAKEWMDCHWYESNKTIDHLEVANSEFKLTSIRANPLELAPLYPCNGYFNEIIIRDNSKVMIVNDAREEGEMFEMYESSNQLLSLQIMDSMVFGGFGDPLFVDYGTWVLENLIFTNNKVDSLELSAQITINDGIFRNNEFYSSSNKYLFDITQYGEFDTIENRVTIRDSVFENNMGPVFFVNGIDPSTIQGDGPEGVLTILFKDTRIQGNVMHPCSDEFSCRHHSTSVVCQNSVKVVFDGDQSLLDQNLCIGSIKICGENGTNAGNILCDDSFYESYCNVELRNGATDSMVMCYVAADTLSMESFNDYKIVAVIVVFSTFGLMFMVLSLVTVLFVGFCLVNSFWIVSMNKGDGESIEENLDQKNVSRNDIENIQLLINRRRKMIREIRKEKESLGIQGDKDDVDIEMKSN